MSQLVRLEGKHSTQNAHCALWGHRLPVRALALSAHGLDNIVKIKFDYGKEDGVGDLLLVRQPLFADLCLKVVEAVSKIAI